MPSVGRRLNPPRFYARHKNSTPGPSYRYGRSGVWNERAVELAANGSRENSARYAKNLRASGYPLRRIAALIDTTQTRVRELLRARS